MPEDLQDAIETNAQQPKSAEADGIRAEQHPLKDQIEADRYLSSKASMDVASRGLRFSVFKPGGAAGCSTS